MKKFVSIICILVLLLFVLSPVVSAQPGDTAPSETAINNAISWAQSLVGEDMFPLGDGSGSSPALGQCGTFVANSYGGAFYYTAYIQWVYSDHQHPGDWNAPRGSLVFFSPTIDIRGHVALCTGNGNIIEAGNLFIKKNTISEEDAITPYLGWAWPPSDWPGRSVGSADAALIIWLPIVIAVILVAGALAVFLMIRSRKLQKQGVPNR